MVGPAPPGPGSRPGNPRVFSAFHLSRGAPAETRGLGLAAFYNAISTRSRGPATPSRVTCHGNQDSLRLL